jgi:hypothetical protein
VSILHIYEELRQNNIKAGGMVQVVECLTSNPRGHQKKEEEEEEKYQLQ